MIRRHLRCDCGNRDDEDVPSLSVQLPSCSAECGLTMEVDYVEDLDADSTRRGIAREAEPEDYDDDYKYDERV